MTISPQVVNNGVQFATGDILSAAAENATVSNAGLPVFTVPSAMNQPTCWADTCLPVVVGDELSAVVASGGGFDHLFFGASGAMVGNVTIIPTVTDFGAIVHNATDSEWYAFRVTLGTAWYKSNSEVMSSMTTGTAFPEAISAYAATMANVDILVCGPNGSGEGRIIKISSGTPTVVYSYAGDIIRDIAASDSGLLAVAVSGSHIAKSADGGATWATATYPTIPAHVGHLRVTWSDLAGGCFIVSGLTSTGQLFWSTSATGASWQAWRKTAQIAIPPKAKTLVFSCGMCALGSTTLVAPYVTHQANTTDIIGAMVSIDSGASWTVIPGSGSFPYCTNIRAIPFGNRAAIIGRNGFTVTPAILANSPSASVSA